MSARPLVFRNRNFALVWGGQVLSQAGTRMYQIALLWWILSVSAERDGLAVALFLVIGALPSIALAPFIGRVIDRSSTRRVMMSAELAAGLAVAVVGVLLATATLTLAIVYAAGLMVALCQAFIDPTLSKAVPELVDTPDIESAIGFETSTQSVASFAGAVFGAVLIDQIGFVGVVGVNAVSYLASAVLLSLARFRGHDAQTPASDAAPVRDGWHLLDGMPFIKRVLIVFAAANFFATPTLLVLPLYTRTTLRADASILGVLEACLWVGLLVGAFSSRLFTVKRQLNLFGGACLLGFAAALSLPAFLVSTPCYMAALFAGGWCLGVNNVKFVALFQAEVPDAIKGRFFALMQALLGATFPAAYLSFGALCDVLSPQTLCLVQSAGLAVVAGAFVRYGGK